MFIGTDSWRHQAERIGPQELEVIRELYRTVGHQCGYEDHRRWGTEVVDSACSPLGLGTLNRKQIAALVGLASFKRDSLPHWGKRSVWGDRATVNSKGAYRRF